MGALLPPPPVVTVFIVLTPRAQSGKFVLTLGGGGRRGDFLVRATIFTVEIEVVIGNSSSSSSSSSSKASNYVINLLSSKIAIQYKRFLNISGGDRRTALFDVKAGSMCNIVQAF
jgi:hypothetical protein